MSLQLGSMAVVLAVLGAGFAWYERSRPSSKLVAMVAALAACAVAGRVVFAAVPNVQATTDVVLLSGYVLGAGPGFAVGAVGALASNLFLGQGPWTPWQMLGWGAIGVAGGALARAGAWRGEIAATPSRWSLALVCALAGIAFGAWMDLFTLVTFSVERTPAAYGAIAGSSAAFNIAHAVGNAVICVLFGPGFIRVLARFRRRFSVTWQPDDATPGSLASRGPALVAAVLLTLLGFSALPQPARAALGPRSAAHYLERAQNRDGGFGAAPRQPSSQLMTGWTVIGLEAEGLRPLDVRRNGRSAIDFMRAHARELTDVGDLERTIIALRGAGLSATSFGGRDLVAELLAHRRGDGSFGLHVNSTAFAILALRADGRKATSAVVRRAAAWLARQQNADGGFSFAGRGDAGDVDDTGSALQALASAGRKEAASTRRALGYLRRQQNADGGLGQLKGSRSNAQSTAWAVQGLVSLGSSPRDFGKRGRRSPLAYLQSLQQGDGSFRYSRTSTQTPVWVTAQAIVAVRRVSLPLRPPARTNAAPSVLATRRFGHGRRVVRRSGHGRRVVKPPGRRFASRVSQPRDRRSPGSPGGVATLKAPGPVVHRSPAGREGSGSLWLAAGLPLGAAVLVAAWLGRRLRGRSSR